MNADKPRTALWF